MSKVSGFISTRTVLWYVVFCGFAVNYMIRININIAIVSMVRKPIQSKEVRLSECIIQPNRSNNILYGNISDQDQLQLNKTIVDQEGFPWDEKQQGLVLGSFFWLHWVTQIPGGILARKYGTKAVLGYSQLLTCILSLIIPWAAYIHLNLLLLVRLIQGIIAGFVWPSMHDMTAKWIPPNERSKFVTAYLGSSVGAALTFPFCGFIIDFINWEAVFYFTGAIGIAWFVAWWFLVFDTPAEHPRISDEERLYIEDSLGQSVTKRNLKTPWRSILLSLPVWMNTLAQWGGVWGLFTLLIQTPTYFKYIHGWDIRMTGFLSGLPHLLRFLFAVFFSNLGDYLLTRQKMTRTAVRKLATAVCVLGQALFTLALAFVDCNATAAIVFVTLATGVHGAVSTGPLASMVDLSPNFASIVLGISGLVTVAPGFLSPAVVGILTYKNQTVSQWQVVFLISFGMLFVSGVLNLIFGSSDIQPWNTPDVKSVEMKALNKRKKNEN